MKRVSHDASGKASRKLNEDILTVGKMEVPNCCVMVLLQDLCNEYQNGIKIDQIVLQDVNPPEQVKPSFNAVNEDTAAAGDPYQPGTGWNLTA